MEGKTMEQEKAAVRDYMTKNVITVRYDSLNNDVIALMKETKHDGYPVVDEEGHIVGIITAYDLLLKDWETEYVKSIMSQEVIVAREDMHINDASRVMFRHGISRLPVVDKERHVKGIMTNTDIVRSHIERSTPTKVSAFRETMEKLYDIKTTLTREQVPVDKIKPTQDRVYADELQGRTYELEKGLAEPTIVVKTGDRYILVDGHHRAVATVQLGLDKIDSYVVDFNQDITLGMEKTAEKQGLKTFNDITIIDDDQHPLIALTETIKTANQKQKISEITKNKN
ncbi:CBS domain-containing protein [Methanobrevibacter ruminantium M1]|uniref:CBS domain-containing protein n=2 Tax=Methanobrevibacter ruminantium TaxID=83816 RepID=D3E0F6_METRM|nr:CBS domain-containing protein [Methanobrevibacter ruminantium M1]